MSVDDRKRIKSSADKRKGSCAEEVILAKFPKKKFIFSIAYDRTRTGGEKWKAACNNGCKDMLTSNNIEDLSSAAQQATPSD
ncbi:Hypothetical protein A7982_11320 [Minicystis rosea]|nr:Hypothetical protein A7982_11320 [Minicystis rosea]